MDLYYFFIKSLAASIAHYLSKLINICFQKDIFPHPLKIASVIPLHKKGERNVKPNNFWLLSLLPTLGNVLEKVNLNCTSKNFKDFKRLFKEI